MTVNDIMNVAESLKNTEATLLPAQPEVDVPEEGIPVLAGLKIRYEDGGMWCGPYVNAEGKLRQFRFKSPSAATPGNWRIIPNDQPAATTASAALPAVSAPSTAPAPTSLRTRLQRFIPCGATAKKQRKGTPCMFSLI